MKNFTTDKFLKIAQNQNGIISKKSLLNRLYKEITPLTRGFFHDNSWEPIRIIYNKFNEILNPMGIDMVMTENHYDKEHSPPQYKIWSFEIRFINQKAKSDTIYGRIMAAGAGSITDPLERYDLTVTMS